MPDPKKKKQADEDEDEDGDETETILEGFDEDEQKAIRARAAANLLTDHWRSKRDKKKAPPAKKKGLFAL